MVAGVLLPGSFRAISQQTTHDFAKNS